MKKMSLVFLSFLISIILYANWDEMQKLLASDGEAYDYFGRSVSVSGNYVAVSASGDSDIEPFSGSAYIFNNVGDLWIEEAKLTASDPGAWDAFGNSISISGDYAVIGASGDDDNGSQSGSAYIFHKNGNLWTEEAKITASDGEVNDKFGISVSLSGDYAVIGASGDDDYGSNSGSAYVFHRTGNVWAEVNKITASDADQLDYFGNSVSLSEDYFVIGSYRDDDNGTHSGSAYIFQRIGNSWIEEAKLIANDGEVYDHFGISVSIFGEYALIGAVGDDDNGDCSGSSYVFHKIGNSWIEETKLTASDGDEDGSFGRSVSIGVNHAIIGADGDDEYGDYSGSAYIFQRIGNSWIEEIKLTASDGDVEDYFGGSVSISCEYAVVGAYWNDDSGIKSGSAYVFNNCSVFCDENVIDITNASLLENYPNPFNPTTSISFSIPSNSNVDLSVYSIKGQKINTLAHSEFNKGDHSINWNGENESGEPVGSGVYLYKLIINGKIVAVKKCLLLK